MKMPRALPFVLVAFGVAGLEGVALASDPVAEALFQEGRRAAQAHDWALACRKFQESLDKERAPGTMLNLADCEANSGKLTDAAKHFEVAAGMYQQGDWRVADAKRRKSAVEQRLPVLTLRLDPSIPAGAQVERDGTPVEQSMLGSPIPMDPGEHVLTVRAPGHEATRRTVRLDEGEQLELNLTAGASQFEGAQAAPAHEVQGARPSSSGGGAGGSPMRMAALVGFGVGAVGLGLGIAGGVITLNAKSTVDNPANCSPQYCNQAGRDAESRGKTWGTVSTAGFIMAGLGAATGTTLWILSPSDSRKTAGTFSVHPLVGGAAVGWDGGF